MTTQVNSLLIHNYLSFGLRFASEINLGEEEISPGVPDVSILRKYLSGKKTIPSNGLCINISIPYWGTFAIRGENEIVLDSSIDIDDPIVSSFLLEKMIPLLLIRRGALVFHASVISMGGTAIALMGPPRIGKSTLALALNQKTGSRILDDDILAAWPDENGLIVRQGWRMIKIWPETSDHFGLDSIHLPRQWPTTEKRVIRKLPIVDRPARLGAIVLMVPGSECLLQPMRPAEAAGELLKRWYGSLYDEIFVPAGGQAMMFEQSVALAKKTSVWRFGYNQNWDDLPKTADVLAEYIISCGKKA